MWALSISSLYSASARALSKSESQFRFCKPSDPAKSNPKPYLSCPRLQISCVQQRVCPIAVHDFSDIIFCLGYCDFGYQPVDVARPCARDPSLHILLAGVVRSKYRVWVVGKELQKIGDVPHS